MNIPSVNNAAPVVVAPEQSAEEGIRTQEQRLERNVNEVARNEDTQPQNAGLRDRALVEQADIVQAVRANARSLDAAGQRIGTLVDIKV